MKRFNQLEIIIYYLNYKSYKIFYKLSKTKSNVFKYYIK